MIQEISYPHLAGGLLVRDVDDAHGHALEILLQPASRSVHRGNYRLPVVLGSPPEDLTVTVNRLEWRIVPKVQVPCGDHIHMGHDPDGSGSLPFLDREDVGPHDRRIRVVRDIHSLNGIESLQAGHEIVRLLPFAVSSVDRGQSREAYHLDHRSRHLINGIINQCKSLLQRPHGNLNLPFGS